ncbi:MAG: homoserine dehydrogenase, partial [Methyloligellaceae bacterium]
MNHPLRLGIAGLGTVGTGLVKLIERQSNELADRVGRAIEIVAVSARNRDKERGINLSRYQWFDDPSDLGRCSDIDAFVELIGG